MIETLKKEYDAVIVGSGLYGAVCAQLLTEKGFSCLVIDKRNHVGGNVYTELIDDIHVHKYGAHIFHTRHKWIWDYINRFTIMHPFVNSPVANYKDEIYNLPFNMNTFNKMWGVVTPQRAESIIEAQRRKFKVDNPKNLEEQAISLVGKDIYEKLIKGYTEKQWGRKCSELPPEIIKRIPVRFNYDNNYFDNKEFQGIPLTGYTEMINSMLAKSEVRLNIDYNKHRDEINSLTSVVIYTGPIDELFDYEYGKLEYRSVRFETEKLPMSNYQGNAVVNYTDSQIPYTRIIEHKHFDAFCHNNESTIISKEYSTEWKDGVDPYYPINDEKNNSLYKRYEQRVREFNIIQDDLMLVVGGRLGMYKYLNMDATIEKAFDCMKELRIIK